MDAWYLLTWLLLSLHMALSDTDRTVCNYLTNYKTADCSQINLVTVPSNLSSEIQVLDLSYNRIRELHAHAFAPYTALKNLYLGHNLISFVEEDTFAGLNQLRTLDLSHNALNTLPVGLLHLPALSRLALSHNRLSALDLKDAPVSDSLSFLSLASCHLTELPALQAFPNLLELNVSDNELTRISPRQLAPLCGLYLLDIRQNPDLFQHSHPCDCYELTEWVKHRKIFYAEEPLNCSLGEETVTTSPCVLKPAEFNTTNCKRVFVALEKKNMWVHWLLPTLIVVAIIFIIVMVAVTLVQSRRSRMLKMEVRNRARII
ncbi:immunoglobulin superfamily containing leucine-rich repeat protein 2-like [Periplaneta americana]|uniref:immunoglobulin superfamily containing leucine-rich repeat protein 2-like n=1 Tax=Periplaneta americana TaxID=6978 RepID=UPI0037E753E8